MGWASAGSIFDPVAKALVELNAPDDMKRAVLGTLIGQLQDGDWDTEGESLEDFQDDPAIVAAFRDHDVILECGVILECDADDDGPESTYYCQLEHGHDGLHKDGDYDWE